MSEVFYSTSEISNLAKNLSFANRIIQGVISSLIWSYFLVARSGYILSEEEFIILCLDYAMCIRFSGLYFVSIYNVCIPE